MIYIKYIYCLLLFHLNLPCTVFIGWKHLYYIKIIT